MSYYGKRSIIAVTIALFVSFIVPAFVSTAASAQILKTYDAALNTLPEAQGWSFRSNAATTPFVAGGILNQGPTGNSTEQAWFSLESLYDFTNMSTIFQFEAELKITQSDTIAFPGGEFRSGYYFEFVDATRRAFDISIGSTSIQFQNRDVFSPLIPFNTTDDFHLFQLVVANGFGILSVDGNPLSVLPVGGPLFPLANQTQFGDVADLPGSTSQLRRLSLSSTSAPEPSTSLLFVPVMTPGLIALFKRIRRRSAFGR